MTRNYALTHLICIYPASFCINAVCSKAQHFPCGMATYINQCCVISYNICGVQVVWTHIAELSLCVVIFRNSVGVVENIP